MNEYRIIVRKSYASPTGERDKGDYLRDENGNTLTFNSGTEAIEYIRKHEGESIYQDGILDWWKDIGETTTPPANTQ